MHAEDRSCNDVVYILDWSIERWICMYGKEGYSGKEVRGGKCREEVTSAICREE